MRFAVEIVAAEVPALHDRHAQRAEVGIRAELEVAHPALGVRDAWDVELDAVSTEDGKAGRRGGGEDAGQRPDAVQRLGEELLLGLAFLERADTHGDPDVEHVPRIEAEVRGLQLDEASHQQSGTGQEHQRHRDLSDHERAAQAPPPEASASALPRVLQGLDQIGVRRLQGGREAEDDRCTCREQQAEGQHRPVQSNQRFTRDETLGDGVDHQRDAELCEQAPDPQAENREQQALDEQLPHQPCSRGAERGAQCHLALASGGAAEEHVGDVGTGDEQQQPDGGGHRVERPAERPDDAVDDVHDLDGEPGRVVSRVDLGHPLCDGGHLGLGLVDRHAALQSCLELEVVVRELRIGSIELHGTPDVGSELRDTRGHHPDQRPGHAVPDERLAEHRGVEAEAVRPRLVAHDEDRRGPRLRIVRGQRATDDGRDPHEREGIAGDQPAGELLGSLADREDRVLEASGNDVLERSRLGLILEELGHRIRVAAARAGAGRVVNEHAHDPIHVRVHRVGIEQDVLNHAEDGGRSADAKGKGEHRRGGEGGSGPEAAERHPGIVAELLEPLCEPHVSPPLRRTTL